MKWKTHIMMVDNKCETLWEGDTSSAFLWVRDILKARPRLQSGLSPIVRHSHSKNFRGHNSKQSGLRDFLSLAENQDIEPTLWKKIKTARPGQEKCFEIHMLSGSVCFSLQLPPIKYYLLNRHAMFMSLATNKAIEDNFTCSPDHQTSIFTIPRAKFTCPGQLDTWILRDQYFPPLHFSLTAC